MPPDGEPRAVAWHIITGEYPPRPGGVADYSYLVAGALARAIGREVHVWTAPQEGTTPEQPGVVVHRETAAWGRPRPRPPRRAIDAFPGPRRLLVQYTTNVWGRARDETSASRVGSSPEDARATTSGR